jgi:hypothetical protein
MRLHTDASRIPCFLFILLFLTNYCTAQYKIQGNVRDQDQNKVPFATIILTNMDSSVVATALADSTGGFLLQQVKGQSYLLTVAAMGYTKKVQPLTLQGDIVINPVLTIVNNQLGQVEIVQQKPLIERKVDRVVFNVAQSITAIGNNGLEAIGKAPGVKVGENSISLVGKGVVQVMINDRLLQISGEDLMRYLQSLSANDIASIEVMANPPARYDAAGNAGLINIVLKRNRKQGYNGTIQAGYKQANYGAGDMGGNISYNTGNWSLYGNAGATRSRFLEGFKTDLYYPQQTWMQSDTGNYKLNEVHGTAGADYQLNSKSSLGMVYTGGTGSYDGSDHVNNPIYQLNGALDSTLKTYAVYHPVWVNHAVNVHYLTSLDNTGKKLSMDADFFNYYRTDISDFESNSYTAAGQVTPWGKNLYYNTAKQNINIYTFKADVELPTRFAKFMVGGKVGFINNYSNALYYRVIKEAHVYDSTRSNEFTYHENTQALYASGSKELGKWTIQVGIRGELTQTKGYSHTLLKTTTNQYFKVFPTVFLTYKLDEDNAYAFTYGKRINRPTFWNLNPYKSLLTAYSYFEGDPYLQPEYNSNFELTHTFKSLFTTAAFLNITNNGFENIWLPNSDTNVVFKRPVNFLTSYRYGISESATLTPLSWWESINLLSISHTTAQSSISNVKDISSFGCYISTNNTFTFNTAKTIMGAVNFWCQFPEVDHISKSDTYYKLDLGIKILTLQKQLAIAVTANDLLRSSASVLYTTVNDIRQTFTNFQVNRNVSVSLTYRFGYNSLKSNTHNVGNEEERSRAQ